MRFSTYSKYKNKKTIIDGYAFDSIKESRRYSELKLLLKAKKIKNLELQPEFTLQISFMDRYCKKYRPITYIADFRYFDNELKEDVVEDVKAFRTEVYKIKKKMFLYSYQDLIFREV